ncbi:MAG: hypothetical protein OEW58_08105 [Gammaproteobacteria bacterium]|nr:hypothetical protein [Gammaproteobacteria bacterium]
MYKVLIALLFGAFALSAQAEINTGIGHAPGKPSAAGPHDMPAGGMGDVGQMMMPPEGPLVEGTVISSIPGAGYVYIEATVAGKKTWIAGVSIDVKKGDKVQFVENTVMENFTSRSLGRTFDRIIFASSLKKVQ